MMFGDPGPLVDDRADDANIQRCHPFSLLMAEHQAQRGTHHGHEFFAVIAVRLVV
jgi:hypothetical protein